ncbi:MAG: hypothetical protein ABFD07_01515 [Methanobacterium sp.]
MNSPVLSFEGCGPKDPELSIKLLKIIQKNRFNIRQLSETTGFSRYKTEPILNTLIAMGFVKKVFGGNARYVVLTSAGEEVVRGLGE